MPVTAHQRALTDQIVTPRRDTLMAFLLAMREDVDAMLTPRMPMLADKPYPLARCREVTNEVVARLRADLQAPDGGPGTSEGLRTLRRFIERGGVVRPIWGALRGQYFQNALQVGALYIDVANDTVVASKPKIEILPLAKSGFEALRGPAHFAEIAARYWSARLYANHAVPSLAPLLPLISIRDGEAPTLQSGTDYMVDLLRRDGFKASQRWLATGPPPPATVVDALRQRAASLPGAPVDSTADAAVEACRAARRAGAHKDEAWREARLRDYLTVRGTDPEPTPA